MWTGKVIFFPKVTFLIFFGNKNLFSRLENRLAPLMGELREQREREKRLMSDFNELEEENCSLQRSLGNNGCIFD